MLTKKIYKSTENEYISNVYSFEFLNREEERSLLKAVILNNDVVAREKLIKANLANVIKTARTLSGYKLPFLDLVQEGNIGLLKALNKFSLEHDVRFSTFAIHYIKSEMFEFIRKNYKIYNGATTKPLIKLFFSLGKYKTHNRSLSADELETISKELNVKVSDIKRMETYLTPHSVVSLDAPASSNANTEGESDFNMTRLDLLVTNTLPPDMELIDTEQTQYFRERLHTSLDLLDPRSKDIVSRRWLDENKPTLSELAKEYSVSHERIRQIEKSAIAKLRALIIN